MVPGLVLSLAKPERKCDDRIEGEIMRKLLLLAMLLLGTNAANAAPTMLVHLLGTGGPELTPDRQGYATLIEAPDELLLFDAGRGVMQQIYEQGINPKWVTRIFLTHLHSDHIAGLPDLWMTPWFLLGRTAPLEIWGPPGTHKMIAGMRAMYGHDIDSRVDRFNTIWGLEVTVHEIVPGKVYERAGLVVTAFAVKHADGDPAFGYRIDRAGHSVVLSGDTTLTPNLVTAAKGADLLVQNVIAFSPRLTSRPEMQMVLAKLTTPEQAAELLKEAQPKLAIFSHIVKKELPGRTGDDAIIARVRLAGYAGPVQIGHDREVVSIDDKVTVSPPPSTVGLPELDGK
ncbi:ribonuclease Z [Sphingomonas sp. YR710]|nr:ribonuclease Z [Sphingomonas sp. YR710]